MKKDFVIYLSVLFLCLLILPCFAYPHHVKGVIYKIKKDNMWAVAVKGEVFKDFVSIQRNTNWCWAACVQMVLNYQGVDAQQEEIVKRVKGDLINDGGTEDEIVKGANLWELGGHKISARYEQYYCKECKNYMPDINLQGIIDELFYKSPMIVRLSVPKEHPRSVWVMTGLIFSREGKDIYPKKVILRDPWPESDSRQELEWKEFSNRLKSITYVFIE